MPQVSIVIPFKDAESTLSECMASIEAQTFRDFEALFIDDGSGDAGPDLVAARCDRGTLVASDNSEARDVPASSPWFRLLSNPGTGIVSALNHGISEAQGEVIVRMDADDIMHPQRIERQMAHLQGYRDASGSSPEIHVSCCCVEPFGEVGPGLHEYFRWQNSLLSVEAIHAARFIECPLQHPTLALRRSILVEEGGYRPGNFPEDYELILRLLHKGYRIEKLNRALLQYRCSPGQLSQKAARYNREAFHRVRKEYLQKYDRLQRRLKEEVFVVWGASRRSRRRFEDHFPGWKPAYFVDVNPNLIETRSSTARRSRSGQHPGDHPVRAGGPPGFADAPGESQASAKSEGLWDVRSPEMLFQDPGRPFVLVYVNARGARPMIEAALQEHDYAPDRDYLCIG